MMLMVVLMWLAQIMVALPQLSRPIHQQLLIAMAIRFPMIAMLAHASLATHRVMVAPSQLIRQLIDQLIDQLIGQCNQPSVQPINQPPSRQ